MCNLHIVNEYLIWDFRIQTAKTVPARGQIFRSKEKKIKERTRRQTRERKRGGGGNWKEKEKKKHNATR